jgi:hypothetical protein
MTAPFQRRSLRLQHNIRPDNGEPKAATAVFDIRELLMEIINHCSWASRVNLSHATVRARLAVHASIRRRIHVLLRPFINDFPSFFALLRETGAAIVGSTAWGVMTIDNLGPQDLNIVVPSGSVYGVERLKALLSCAGSSVISDGSAGILYEKCASRFIKLLCKTVSIVPSTFVTTLLK